MRRLFAITPLSGRSKPALLLGTFVGALAATGFGAYAAASGSNTINACALKTTGALRISNSTCLPSEQALQWNQTGPPGPPGPPGNSDSVVRHISGFKFDGTTITTPLLSGRGEMGTLSLRCGSDGTGNSGEITYTRGNTGTINDSATFYSPSLASPPAWSQVSDHVTYTWNHTAGNNMFFEIILESQLGAADPSPKPVLADIHGTIQEFPQFGGCAYYVHVDTSDVASPETFTP
jgi:hypothetical protein